MSAIDTYGELELPEERTEIEIVENPVQVVMSAYEVFKRLVDENIVKKYMYQNIRHELHERTYQEALKVFEEKTELKTPTKELEQITADMQKKPKDHHLIGLFLSAFHNQTNLKTMIINNLHFYQIGHKLKSDKKLVIGKNSEASRAGEHREGTIINYGKIKDLYDTKNQSIDINLGNINYVWGTNEKAIQINKKTVNCIWTYYKTYINDGEITNLINGDRDGLFGIGPIHPKRTYYKQRYRNFSKKLEQKLSEIKFLETLTELPYEEQYKQIDEFDFNKFEKETREIVEEMYKREKSDEHD